MPVIALFSGVFCGEEEVIREVVSAAEFTHVTDDDVAERAEAI
ncbi:MAG: response regulator, partial [Desulfobacterales bacterium]|nr:response regulator [Desulfobacterales bacterium]